MSLSKQHELHVRRRGRNIGLGLTLVAFVVLIMGLTVVKVTSPEFQMPQTEAADGN